MLYKYYNILCVVVKLDAEQLKMKTTNYILLLRCFYCGYLLMFVFLLFLLWIMINVCVSIGFIVNNYQCLCFDCG